MRPAERDLFLKVVDLLAASSTTLRARVITSGYAVIAERVAALAGGCGGAALDQAQVRRRRARQRQCRHPKPRDQSRELSGDRYGDPYAQRRPDPRCQRELFVFWVSQKYCLPACVLR